eukprot:TRINITY_DN8379_c1_g1_i1.p2 TRINITY_DN8379_c1_g1~~TRINITY_DN8379_c1_g1_i1.p2  ORF type:complete len:214 (+),score=60.40 TRINITY_DN8379_c1_g1_i1:50-691(+)
MIQKRIGQLLSNVLFQQKFKQTETIDKLRHQFYFIQYFSNINQRQIHYSINSEQEAEEEAGDSDEVTDPKIIKLADEIAALSLLEASDLTKLLSKKFGIQGGAMPMGMPMGMPMAGGGAQGAAGGETEAAGGEEEKEEKKEQTEFKVSLDSFDAAGKIKIIKEVRVIVPGLGLKEAKEMVEKAPQVLKEGVTREEAEEIKQKLEGVGAKISIS